jgi:predicted TIM-barrel fold metal-dependent hydrolase
MDETIVDGHVHVFDPARVPFAPDVHYVPTGPEIGTAEQLARTHDAHGVRHALLVGPNSGYGEDNRYLLDVLATARDRYRGMAVVPTSAGKPELAELRAAGVVGVTLNAALLGVDHYRDAGPQLAALAELDMIADVQVVDDQLLALGPALERAGVRVVVDHCGRPDPAAGLGDPGFRELLRWGRAGRAVVKLSGLVKFSHLPHPHEDTWPHVAALLDAGGGGVGVGLALPAGARPHRLRPAARARRAAGARRRGPAAGPVGHPAPRVLRRLTRVPRTRPGPGRPDLRCRRHGRSPRAGDRGGAAPERGNGAEVAVVATTGHPAGWSWWTPTPCGCVTARAASPAAVAARCRGWRRRGAPSGGRPGSRPPRSPRPGTAPATRRGTPRR